MARGGILAALLLILFFAYTAAAQETNTTYPNITITVPVVTITARELWTVTYHFENDTLVLILSCSAAGACPDIHVVVGWNGTVYLDRVYSAAGNGTMSVRVEVLVPSEAAWVYYAYDGVERNETVYKQRVPPEVGYAVLLIVVGMALGAAVRSDARTAAAGLIAASLVPWLLAVRGYAPPEALIASLLMVIGGAVLLAAAGR